MELYQLSCLEDERKKWRGEVKPAPQPFRGKNNPAHGPSLNRVRVKLRSRGIKFLLILRIINLS